IIEFIGDFPHLARRQALRIEHDSDLVSGKQPVGENIDRQVTALHGRPPAARELTGPAAANVSAGAPTRGSPGRFSGFKIRYSRPIRSPSISDHNTPTGLAAT